jgi:hypothetical protein
MNRRGGFPPSPPCTIYIEGRHSDAGLFFIKIPLCPPFCKGEGDKTGFSLIAFNKPDNMAAGIRISMDGVGRAIDNIFVERLWRSLKYEEVYLKDYETVQEAKDGITV